MFAGVYAGARVLVTGHTGFKGSMLSFWLNRLGAELCGVALAPETVPNHFELLQLPMRSELCDIRNRDRLGGVIRDFRPDVVFHLAAQPLVRRSYREPVETFEVNAIGTANLLDACCKCDSVRAVVVVTSDKCYENREDGRAYSESDPMGGFDPYSASKGCTELVTASFRNSFCHPSLYGKTHHCLIASARAGNVIGGGDWAEDRLIPDLMRSAAAGRVEEIRSPNAVRPWQHVFEPLSGYLLLGSRLLAGDTSAAEGWNFGPAPDGCVTVGEIAEKLGACWPAVRFVANPPPDAPHEAHLLHLDCSKAAQKLAWRGVWALDDTLQHTALWYRKFYETKYCATAEDLEAYITTAAQKGLSWIR